MKSISGVRGWAGTALDALESQDIYHLFRNKKKGKKSTLKCFILKAIDTCKNCQITNNNKFQLLISGLFPVQNTILKYNTHENSNLGTSKPLPISLLHQATRQYSSTF